MTERDSSGRWLPGCGSPNPTGRPTIRVSLVKLLQDRLEGEEHTAKNIIDAWIKKMVDERDMPAIKEALDRIDGKVASEVNLRGLIVHVGNEYAALGLESARQDLEERKQRYLDAPQR